MSITFQNHNLEAD